MTPEELLLLFSRLRMAPVNGGRAIHKPLLVLFWLGRLERGEPRLARFVEVEARFKQLLTEFGSSNSPQTRHLPFWHLCNDADGAVWELQTERGIRVKVEGGPPGVTWFRQNDIRCGFTSAIDDLLRHDAATRASLARNLLAANFPETLHGDIAA